MMYPNSKPVVIEVCGNVAGWFECISDVARKFGHRTTTITKRIDRKAVIDGVLVRYPYEGENLENVPYLSPTKPYGTAGKAIGYRVRKEKIVIVKPPKPKPVYKDDDVELDREKYKIVPYEVRFGRVSITRCPFKRYPQPLVGSGECMRCSAFKGRNKKTHEVACSSCYI